MSSLMANGIDAASHAADDQSASRGKVAAEVLRYLRAVERGAARADNARTREIANLRIAAHVKKNRWVINLQQVLGIFGSVQFRRLQLAIFRTPPSSFSARLKDCFFRMACATSAGRWPDSISGSEARNTPSGEPNLRSTGADWREARKGRHQAASRSEPTCRVTDDVK
jgi:hypothetical protein